MHSTVSHIAINAGQGPVRFSRSEWNATEAAMITVNFPEVQERLLGKVNLTIQSVYVELDRAYAALRRKFRKLRKARASA